MNYLSLMGMEQLKQEITDKFSHVKFTAETHSYIVNGKAVPSVSKIISRYKQPFNKNYWLPIKAKQLNMSVEALGKQWDDKRDNACDLGHQWHTYIEERLLNQPITVPIVPLVDRFLEQDTSTTLFCELVMGNQYLTGTLDNLIMRDGKLIIRDWKTNGELRKSSRYKLLYPFNKIDASEFNIYTIQQNLYRRLLGIDDVEMELVWFDRENDDWEIMPIPRKDDWCNYIIRKLVNDYDH